MSFKFTAMKFDHDQSPAGRNNDCWKYAHVLDRCVSMHQECLGFAVVIRATSRVSVIEKDAFSCFHSELCPPIALEVVITCLYHTKDTKI